jgi:diguanylate cyclase (GGDEF)-like protein
VGFLASPVAVVGLTYRDFTHPDDVPADEAATALLLAGGPAPTLEKRYRHRDGHVVWARVTVRLVHDEEARLRSLALHDPLTGAANRALLEDRLAQALAARDRDGGLLGVVFAGVDAFKALNDQRGHAVGDQVLAGLAQAASAVLREHDTVARVGGDEFVFVLHVPSRPELDRLLQRLDAALHIPVLVEGGPVLVGTSCGVAVVDRPGHTAAGVLAEADALMYATKRHRTARPSPSTGSSR